MGSSRAILCISPPAKKRSHVPNMIHALATLVPALIVAPRLAPLANRRTPIAMNIDHSGSTNFTAGDVGRVTPTNIDMIYGRVVSTLGRDNYKAVSAPQDSAESSHRVWNDRSVSFKYSGERLQNTLYADADLNVAMQLWHGTDTLSYQLRTFADSGHPLSVVVETPDDVNVLTIHNLARDAKQHICTRVESIDIYESQAVFRLMSQMYAQTTQCATLTCNFPFGAPVESVLVILDTKRDESLNARVELLNSTGAITQVVEVYSTDGHKQPLECVLKTPGMQDYVVRIINTSRGNASHMKAAVMPYSFIEADIDVF